MLNTMTDNLKKKLSLKLNTVNISASRTFSEDPLTPV